MADLGPVEREALLRERAGHDPALRAEIGALLAAIDDSSETFLDPALIPTLDMSAVDGPLQPGTRLGHFLVLHALGSGGMGVVYAAQQDRPRRTVAIKVLRRGYRHPDIVQRSSAKPRCSGGCSIEGIARCLRSTRATGAPPRTW